jgi:hypothetical protein
MISLPSNSRQETTIDQMQPPKKKSRNVSSSNPIQKRTKSIWNDLENLTLMQILSTSFSDESMSSMRPSNTRFPNKWEILTNEFNEKSGSNKTERQVYKKVRATIIQDDYLKTPFKLLLSKSKLSQHHQSTNEQTQEHPIITIEASSTTLSESSSETTNAESSSEAPFPNLPPSKIEATHNNLRFYSKILSKGYLEGLKFYTEKKETNPSLSHPKLNFDLLKTYDLQLGTLIYHLGYNCAIKRLQEADTKNIDHNLLYPPSLTTSPFNIQFSCYLQVVEDVKARSRNEGYMPIISMPFTNIDSTLFQEPIQQQVYKIFFNYSINRFNKAKTERIEQLNKKWLDLDVETSLEVLNHEELIKLDLDFSSLDWNREL